MKTRMRILTMVCVALAGPVAWPATYYVSPTGNDTNNGTTWAQARQTIQAGVNAATNGDTVRVTNGTYVLTSQVLITNGITVCTVNGASSTIVDGGYPANTNRCFLVSNPGGNVVLDGFTVRNGYASAQGGGVRLEWAPGSMVRNCIVISNYSESIGGGVYLHHGGFVYNCTIVTNAALSEGGGIYAYDTAGGQVRNCIIYFNSAASNANYGFYPNPYAYCCTTPDTGNPAASNLYADPQFISPNNLRLSSTSPCIDRGISTQSWMSSAMDADGRARVIAGVVDIGAYEAAGTQHVWTTGGDIESSPAIGTNGVIYVGSWDGKLYAFNPNGTTQRVWSIGATIVCSPTIGTNGTIYVGANNGQFYAFNPDGTTQHVWTAGDMFYFSSPALGADGTIYAGSRDNNLYAFNPDGTTQHVWTTGGDIDYSSPAIDTNGVIYVGSADSNLYAFAPNGTTSHVWRTGGAIKSSPAIGSNGTIYVGSEDFRLYAFNPDGTTQRFWMTGARITPAPAIAPDGTIYVGSDDNNIYAFHPSGGTNHVWTTGADAYSGPAVGSDGIIYAGSADGKLYAFNPDGTTNQVWVTGGFVFSSPTIGTNGVVYVGSADNNLYAFYGMGGGLAMDSPWPKYRQNLRNTGRRETLPTAQSPSITAQPQSRTNNPGQSATFSVQAVGTAPLSYQWQKWGTNLAGATSTNYTIGSVQQADEGDYRCVVTNVAGSATSAVAVLVVNDPPSLPAGVAASDGTYTDKILVTWGSVANATGYTVWRHTANATNSVGQIGSSASVFYEDTTPTVGVTYYYWVKATNAAGASVLSASDSGWRSALYTITATAGAGGTISPSGTVSVTYGSNKTYTITASAGYQIAGVLVDSVSVGAVSSYTFTNVTANHTISATFVAAAPTTYTITPSAGVGGSIAPSIPVSVNLGGSQAFQIMPATGFRIQDVAVDGSSVGTVSLYTFNDVRASHTISARFVTNQPPVLVLQVTRQTGSVPLRVTYDFTGSTDSDGRIVRYEVDRNGDGVYEVQNEGSGVFVVEYPEAGTFNSLARIVDNDGANARTTVVVVVLGTGPVASLQVNPSSGHAPLSASLIGTNSTAPAGRRIVAYEWDPDGNGVYDRVSTTGVISWVYREAGTYTVGLRVTDDTGIKASATATVLVEAPVEDPPTVTLTVNPASGNKPLRVAFTAVVANAGSGISAYLWDFDGDGADDMRTTVPTATNRYTQAGRFEAKVSVIANSGLMGTDTEWVQVSEAWDLQTWITTPNTGDRVWGTEVSLMARAAPGSQVAWVQYQFKKSDQGTWANLGVALVPPPNSYSMTWDVTGLTNGADYEIRTVAGDTSGGSVTSDVVTVRVDSGAAGQVGGTVEGEVNGQHRKSGTYSQNETAQMEVYDGTTVEVPMGTVESTFTMEIILTDRNVNPTNGAASGRIAIHENRTITIEGNPELQRAIIIDVPYPDEDNDGIVDGTRVKETTLNLYWYNTASNRWEMTLGSEVHADENFIRATTYHLTEFGAFGSGSVGIQGDYDGDGISDLAVFDQNTGNWYIRTLPGSLLAWAVGWGWPGAEPVSGDFDGDGVSDLAVFDQNTGNWYIRTMSGANLAWAVNWGWPGVQPVSGDYDGDGVSDLGVYENETGHWFVRTMAGEWPAWQVEWGWSDAVPVPGDYDGDGTSDYAVFGQDNGLWYIMGATGNLIAWELAWGWPGATPVAGDFDGDGISDLAILDDNTGAWYIRTVSGTLVTWAMNWGWPGAAPVSGDFNGGGQTDMAVFDSNTGNWYIRTLDGEFLAFPVGWGWPGATPIR